MTARLPAGKPGDSLYKHVGGDVVVVGSKLPALLEFRLITSSGRLYDNFVHVPRSGIVRNRGADRIVSVPPRKPYCIIWVSGPSSIRRELQERSPWKAVRRYARNHRGWRAKLRGWIGLK